ncbi:conserved hypothetical protein [Culex quinquefasciatus]|uniref:Apoptosis regulatory protein Siva n=1 Tax=Culex quinquefasciatus TaxID=7176 RepID=B0XIQ3_CULQU|nr:conserved hypothetical protein [Culex quinquefasciatus]|eukprot:XP_001869525.1 conserved hypothetical protein [Culex quinquefasciatus]
MCDILVMNLNGNRKRLRSDDGEGGHLVLQRKMFINQQRMDQQDERKMKQIQDKTLNMAGHGWPKTTVSDRPSASGSAFDTSVYSALASTTLTLIVWMEKKPDRKCCICGPHSAVHAECTNCNLELCEYCGVSCQHCPEKICMNCVNIFNCQTSNVPCCERCKIFN